MGKSRRVTTFNIRGPSGSGKSYIVEQLLANYGGMPVQSHGEVIAHITIVPSLIWVVGPYTGLRVSGCDALRDLDRVEAMVESVAVNTNYHVVFEGMMVSASFERWWELSKRIGGMRWLFLNTSVDECMKRLGPGTKKGSVQRKYRANAHQFFEAAGRGEHAYEVAGYEDVIRVMRQEGVEV